MIVSLLFLLIFILGISFWMWMLADCATNESDRSNDRLIWTLIILIANVFGALLYWKVRRPQRLAEANRYLTQAADRR
jgi:predicted permease